jgi:hypothetical protein
MSGKNYQGALSEPLKKAPSELTTPLQNREILGIG